MSENREQKLQADRDEHAARTRPLFAELSRGRQIFALIVIPIMFGVLAALMLRWSVPAWWTWQALGVLGAVAAGREHRRRRSAAIRGAVGGLAAATATVCVRALIPGEDVADFDPASYPVIAAIASAGLHAGGTALRRRAKSTTASAL